MPATPRPTAASRVPPPSGIGWNSSSSSRPPTVSSRSAADATIADALAHVRNPELTPSLAALVYVCRQPLETPTGKFLGIAHIQRLLREPPSTLVAGALDDSMASLRPEASIDEVAAHLATYNLVAAPVVDENGHLLGAVTVDDLLDHMLPEGWRDRAVSQ